MVVPRPLPAPPTSGWLQWLHTQTLSCPAEGSAPMEGHALMEGLAPMEGGLFLLLLLLDNWSVVRRERGGEDRGKVVQSGPQPLIGGEGG